jgi:DNA-binding LacI/PurR family transcriptional regulator
VTGFDHVPWSDLVRPKLTTVDVPVYKLGQEAARQLSSYVSYEKERFGYVVQLIYGMTTQKVSHQIRKGGEKEEQNQGKGFVEPENRST